MILLNLKNGNKNTGGLTRGSGQIAGPSSQTPGRAVDDGLEYDSDETEILPDINTDDETDEDDGPAGIEGANPAKEFQPGAVGQLQVEQNDVRRLLAQQPQPLAGRGGLQHLQTIALEDIA